MSSRLLHAVRTLLPAFAATPKRAHPDTPLVAALRAELDTLKARVDALARAELERQAEHAAMLDSLSRLYKRVSARIAREQPPGDTPSGESTLTLRSRLRR